MPYSKDELQNLPFYQAITSQDESRYLEMIGKQTNNGIVDGGDCVGFIAIPLN